MADYKMVKHCRVCRKRFFAYPGKSNRNYCDDCQKAAAKAWNSKD